MIYHKDINLPKHIRGMVPKGVKSLKYSNHAQKEFRDKNGNISPPNVLDFSLCTIVEVTIHNSGVDKLVLRQKYNDSCDIVLVAIPTENRKVYFVKTCWLNKSDDTHSTLDVNRFPASK